MAKSTKTTRKTTQTRASKPQVRATSKRSNSKKSNSIVFGRFMPKRRSHWALLIVVVVLVGAIGSWMLYNSNANTYALSPAGCKIRGRVGQFDEVKGQYLCYSACRPYAGDYIANPNGYGYCSHAVTAASVMSQTKCSSLGRKWVGYVGCARHWMEAAYPDKNVFYNALQCAHDGDDYHVSNSYDYCGSGSPTPTNGIIVGSMPAVGGPNWPGTTDCVAFIKWVLNNHSSRYAGEATGDGRYVAGNLRTMFGYKNIRAPHSVVSMTSSQSAGHVALVDTVHSDGSIVVEESNWNGHWDQRSISASAASGMSYAYISDWE
jgi:hypothetical protein